MTKTKGTRKLASRERGVTSALDQKHHLPRKKEPFNSTISRLSASFADQNQLLPAPASPSVSLLLTHELSLSAKSARGERGIAGHNPRTARSNARRNPEVAPARIAACGKSRGESAQSKRRSAPPRDAR